MQLLNTHYEKHLPETCKSKRAGGQRTLTALMLMSSAFLSLIFSALAMFAFTQSALAQQLYYRYIDEQGLQVVESKIPSQYIANGYDILDGQGLLVERVPPAKSKSEYEREQAEQELFDRFIELKKRYSNVEEIDMARDRRLAGIRINVGVLKGNVSNIKDKIDVLTARAASFERDGREVPEHIRTEISSSQEELRNIADLLKVRQRELDRVNAQFDEDIELFSQGEKLIARMQAKEEAR